MVTTLRKNTNQLNNLKRSTNSNILALETQSISLNKRATKIQIFYDLYQYNIAELSSIVIDTNNLSILIQNETIVK